MRVYVQLEGYLALDLATAEQPHAVARATQRTRLHQRLGIDDAGGVELAGIDRVLDTVEIDLDQIERENVGKAALRQPPMQRHLAAFEALDAHAGTRGLALAAAAGLLALAGADA